MPGQEERMEWKGLAARLRDILLHSLGAARDLERKERGLPWLLLGLAHARLEPLKSCQCFFDVSSEASACGGVGRGNEDKCGRRPSARSSWLFARRDNREDLRGRLLNEME